MLNEEKKILNDNTFLNNRKKHKEESHYLRIKISELILALFIFLCFCSLTYFLSDVSNIYRISVKGNIYLTDEDIIEISGLNLKDKFLFTAPKRVEKKLLENALIKDAKVSLDDDRLVTISIIENKAIGYAYENKQNVLILDNDERYELDENNIYLIEKVPLIEGFTAQDITLIEKNLVDVDYKMINEISEIHYYPDLKYQNNMLIMEDGNYIFSSPYGLYLLNKYYDLDNSFDSNDNSCYYFEDISGNAYISACPWQIKKETDKDIDN